MKRSSALTLLELMIVVVVIALLIAVLVPSLGSHRPPATRAACMANLKAIGTGAWTYAADWNGKLPTGAGVDCLWLSDLPAPPAEALRNAMMSVTHCSPQESQRAFLCPANLAPPASHAGIRIIGYTWLGPRDPPTSLPDLSTLPRTNPPLMYYTQVTGLSNASSAILAADWIISPNASATRFTEVTRPGITDSFSTSHLSAAAPAGANLLCLDGHVEWRTWAGPPKAAAAPCIGATFWIPR